MIKSHELKNRKRYLKKLIDFQDTEPVKVITGIRRCGKSSLLKLMIRHLRETGVQDEQIVEMNFESHDFRNMTSDEVYQYVKGLVVPGKRMYLFLDELQRINAWEDAVNSFRVDLDCDIYLRTLGKYYIVDIGLRNYLLGFRNRDSGHAIENIVYFELFRRGYDIAIGKIGNQEVDFIATTADDKIYIQVTESMQSEDVRKRELAPLRKIRDNYKKIILSLEPGLDASYDGIESLNLIDWLIGE